MKMRPLLLVSASAILVACHSTTRIPVPVSGTPLRGNPQVITVVRLDRSSLVVYNPVVQGDSLIGFLDPARADSAAGRQRVAVAISNVQSISARKVDPLKTTGAAVGGVVLLYGVLLALALGAYFAAY